MTLSVPSVDSIDCLSELVCWTAITSVCSTGISKRIGKVTPFACNSVFAFAKAALAFSGL